MHQIAPTCKKNIASFVTPLSFSKPIQKLTAFGCACYVVFFYIDFAQCVYHNTENKKCARWKRLNFPATSLCSPTATHKRTSPQLILVRNPNSKRQHSFHNAFILSMAISNAMQRYCIFQTTKNENCKLIKTC